MKKLSVLAQVTYQISIMIQSKNSDIANLGCILDQPRKYGSITEKKLLDLNSNLKLIQFNPIEEIKNPKWNYYYVHGCFSIGGKIGVTPLYQAQRNNQKVHVRYNKNLMNQELYIDKPANLQKMTSVGDITIIQAPDPTGEFDFIIAEWYPGKPLASLDLGWKPQTAVSIHRGLD